jgi:DNA polymerase-3 subunit gamma/tau
VSYQVLARRWRPLTFEAVVGQAPIVRTLRNALAQGRIAHAYLFAGPRGVGKTTTARLLAMGLNCEGGPGGGGPCAQCEPCREVASGRALDVIEIDGASNRGIDEVRALRDNARYAPARGRRKVYIIDEVHMLTEPAFNALLKILEEPPAHVAFVLATTEARRLPATILSRCQRFDFRPIAGTEISEALQRILAEERMPADAVEPDALRLLARAADGSLRDALSLLDTALAYGEGRVSARTVEELLGSGAPRPRRSWRRRWSAAPRRTPSSGSPPRPRPGSTWPSSARRRWRFSGARCSSS